MNCPTARPRRAWVSAPLIMLLAASGATGCNLLDVSDPTAILEDDVNDAQGAELLRRGALRGFFQATGEGAWQSGLVADEFFFQLPLTTSPAARADELLDQRASAEYEGSFASGSYSRWQDVRMKSATVALEKLRAYAPPGAREARVGEMFAVRGYATMRLAEDFCPGFPLHEIVNFETVLGPPVSTDDAFRHALADFDSAVSWAADSARVLNFARAGRARTLLNLGRFAEAATAAAAVPTAYVYQTEWSPSTNVPTNPLASEPGCCGFQWTFWGVDRSVANQEGGNGIDFVSATDPRALTIQMGTARDGVTPMYGIAKYPSRFTPIVLASGVEARLIEAEAALQAGDPNWLTILNDLRANQISPPLSPLADPGTAAARVDLLFRERALWLFATGTRLGDLRRLVRLYGRPPESVFPTGAYWRGGVYDTGTAVPFGINEIRFSPGITGCTSR